jgi:acetyl-CoA carboxylase carboxyl transferase subunit beta
VRFGETLHEAVVRELAEETGLAVVVESFLGWVERLDVDDDEPSHFVILDFAVAPLEPDAEPNAGDDAVEVAWVDLGDLGNYHLVPGLFEFLDDVGVLPV